MVLIDDIKANRCILFTGPFMTTFEEEQNADWISHTELYCSDLKAELQKKSIPFDARFHNNPYYLMRKWLANDKEAADKEIAFADKAYRRIPNLYTALSVIPFNTIVNFGFDHLMKEALAAEGYEFAFRFYNYKGAEVKNTGVDKDLQLVYNLFGSIDEPKSRIMTEDDQLEFLRAVSSVPCLPEDLLCRIKDDSDKKSYIFMGFDFEDWPYRFLLDTLGVPRTGRAVMPRYAGSQIAVMAHEFFRDRFGIEFLDQSPKKFVLDLIDGYKRNLIEHRHGYISFVRDDEAVRNDFRKHLNVAKLGKQRIRFWDKALLGADDIVKEVIGQNLTKATVYIPLISFSSISDDGFNKEMLTMKDRPEVLFFPIICDNCLWADQFPWLEKRASIVLPGKDEVLNSSQKKASNEDYIKIIRTINSKIR